MVNEFHLSNAVRETVVEERRSAGIVDADLWHLASDDFVDWLVRPN
jgi:hypothetical protein